LLCASTTKKKGAPPFAHFAKEPAMSAVEEPALSEAEGADSTSPVPLSS
jgi:hypothetical protein